MSRTSMLAARIEKTIFKSVLGNAIAQYRNKQIIYSQGKRASTLFYIREGNVMLTIRSKGRRPAVITVLGAGDFFGQCCLAGVPLRICTATAIGSCSILTIKKKEMIRDSSSGTVSLQVFSHSTCCPSSRNTRSTWWIFLSIQPNNGSRACFCS